MKPFMQSLTVFSIFENLATVSLTLYDGDLIHHILISEKFKEDEFLSSGSSQIISAQVGHLYLWHSRLNPCNSRKKCSNVNPLLSPFSTDREETRDLLYFIFHTIKNSPKRCWHGDTLHRGLRRNGVTISFLF